MVKWWRLSHHDADQDLLCFRGLYYSAQCGIICTLSVLAGGRHCVWRGDCLTSLCAGRVLRWNGGNRWTSRRRRVVPLRACLCRPVALVSVGMLFDPLVLINSRWRCGARYRLW
ncbi:hypothetical protein KCP74_24150 [Salmonella enterica subsp. enterica]|nr:hypothetical protein KCP74_24150 [Salmonella enterica subsp. enterica]